jgi:hypothetical protein
MAEVALTSNLQPAPACYPSDVNGMLRLCAEGGGLSGTIPDQAGGGIYVSSSPPASSLTNKVWYKIDGAGRPLGVFMFYNGNWRKVYTGVGLREIRQYYGTNAVFDSSGRGLVGGDFDGWAVCNGNNGTPQLHGCNLKGGLMGAQVGQGDGRWSDMETPGTWVESGGTYGPRKINIQNLPELIYEIFGVANTKGSSSGYGLGVPTDIPINFGYVAGGSGGGTTQGSPNTPLAWETYTVVAHIMFIGYQ